MIRIIPLLAVLFVASVYMAYQTSYDVQAAAGDLNRVNREIRAEIRHTAMLRAEWAFLNRGDRLAELAERFHASLLLGPVLPAQIGVVPSHSQPVAVVTPGVLSR